MTKSPLIRFDTLSLQARALFERTNDAVFILNLEGAHLEVNQQASDMLGYTVEELVGMSYGDVVAPYEYPNSERILEALLAGESISIYERDFRDKDGTDIPVEINVTLVYDAQGTPVYIQSIVRDITKRKRAERLLRALNDAALAMHKTLSPVGIFTAVGEELEKVGIRCVVFLMDDSQNKLLPAYLNFGSQATETLEKLIGVKTEEFSVSVDAVNILKDTVREKKIISVDNPESFTRQMMPVHLKIFAGQIVKILGISKIIVAPLIVDDKTMGVFSVLSDNLIEEDKPTLLAFAHQMAAVWRRTSLTQNLENELVERKRAEELFRNIFENAVMGFYRSTPDGRILMANPALVQMMGYSSFEALAQIDLEKQFTRQGIHATLLSKPSKVKSKLWGSSRLGRK